MALLVNLIRFGVVFLPLTLAIAVPFDLYVGRYQPAEEASQIFYWIFVGWPLLVPSILFFPVAHLALAITRRAGIDPEPATLKKIAVVILPIGLLAVHLLLWGDKVLGVPLLASFIVPGAVLGLFVKIPEGRAAKPE